MECLFQERCIFLLDIPRALGLPLIVWAYPLEYSDPERRPGSRIAL